MSLAEVQTRLEEQPNAFLAQIAEFCQHWKIDEVALFGSVLRDNFRPGSGIDGLVTFVPNSGWSLFD